MLKVSECDFSKPQHWTTSSHFGNFKFSGVICEKNWLIVKLICNKNLFSEKIHSENAEKGQFCSSSPLKYKIHILGTNNTLKVE